MPLVLRLTLAVVVLSTGSAASGRERRPIQQQSFDAIRGAFREATRDARPATVRVVCDGANAAYGVIVRPDGWVLTKGSELAGGGAGTITVRLTGGRDFAARHVGYDPIHDLSLLKIDGKDLPTIQWADRDPAPGTFLAAAGLDAEPIASGVVSVARRSIPRLSGVLGIRLKSIPGPAEIDEVFANGAAEAAGILTGDVVEQIGEVLVKDRESLVREIRRHQPGDVVALAIRRRGDPVSIKAQLTHPFGDFLSRVAEQNQMGGALSNRRADFPAVIQHDMVLSPGECGGPVVDLSGKVVGLNIARAGRTESFLIPASEITPLIDDLIAGKFPPPPPVDLNPVIPPPPPLAVTR